MVGGGVWIRGCGCVCGCVGGGGAGWGVGVGRFTNVLQAHQNILSKCVSWKSYFFFKLKFCSCVQSMALGTRTNFQLEICNINVIYGTVYFHKIILKGLQNISETTTWLLISPGIDCAGKWGPGLGQGKNFLPAPSKSGEMVEKINIFSCFLWTIQHKKS